MTASKHLADTFHLYIRQADELPYKYFVSTTNLAKDEVTVHFSASAEFDMAIAKLYARGANRVLRTIPDQDLVTSFIGESLFTAFIRGAVLDEYYAFKEKMDLPQSAPYQRIALHLPRSLYRLPWEILRDPDHPPGLFLSLTYSVIRVDGDAKGPDPRYNRIPPKSGSLEMLFVVSNPSDRPIGDFDPIETEGVKFHAVKPATYSNFQKVTGDKTVRPDGFVFLGHGDIHKDANNVDYGVLIFVKMQGMLMYKTTLSDPRQGTTVGTDLAAKSNMRLGCPSCVRDSVE
jgi:hypothetical protein